MPPRRSGMHNKPEARARCLIYSCRFLIAHLWESGECGAYSINTPCTQEPVTTVRTPMWLAYGLAVCRQSLCNVVEARIEAWRHVHPKGPHPRQRFSTATAMCSQIAVAVDDLPIHATTDLFNLSQLNRSSLIVTKSDLASDDKIAHQIPENSDPQQPPPQSASCGGGCSWWSPYTGNLVDVAIGNCGCGWKSLSWIIALNSQRNHPDLAQNFWPSPPLLTGISVYLMICLVSCEQPDTED